MGEAATKVVKGDARRIGGISEKGNGRGHNDGRGRSDNHRRCKDEVRRRGCIKFEIRVGTIRLRKKKS